MDTKDNLNTVILLLILAAVLVGGFVMVSTVRSLTRPIADAGGLLLQRSHLVRAPDVACKIRPAHERPARTFPAPRGAAPTAPRREPRRVLHP